MNTRSNDEKFRTLTNPDELLALHEKASSSVYRQSIHIQPVSGLLNDPNGFIYFNDTWHLFYQWCPWGAFHGLKHWYHVSSKDLITWKNEGLCIRPDTYFDNKGVFSGTAMPYKDQRKMRALHAFAAKCELDAQGRVLLPQSLRERVGLSKNVTVLGANNHAEFWDSEEWAALRDAEASPENIAAVMQELDF